MILQLKIALSILKKEGFLSLAKKGFDYYIFSLLLLPFCLAQIKKLKYKNINELLDFVFHYGYGYLAPLQIRSELKSLALFVKDIKPKIIMEIGTARGGTLFLLSKMIPRDALIISLDLPGGSFGGGAPWWKIPLYKSFATHKQTVSLVRKNSHQKQTFMTIKKIVGNQKIDFLFIDGDHSYEGVKKDFELYKQLVKPSGSIAFHDIVAHPAETKCKVDEFWNSIKTDYEHKEFIENQNQNWAGIGIIKV